MSPGDFAIVIPTVGRPSLHLLLADLAAQTGPPPTQVVVVDDRATPEPPIDPPADAVIWAPVRVLLGLGRGPAAARNLGAAVARADWVAFLDDDVRVGLDWSEALAADLAAAGARVAGVQARLEVPLPADRRPTDWERSTAGLEGAHWITADMAFRRAALLAVHGFDARFPRAYREDADLALRLRRSGWQLVRGSRTVTHPVRPSARGSSVRAQRGNADDALMRRLHGRSWRRDAQAGRGRLRWHLATVAAALGTATAAATASAAAATASATRVAVAHPGAAGDGTGPAGTDGLPRRSAAAALRRSAGRLALGGAAGWLALTADFAARRILPGPRTRAETAEMLWTSAVIPFAAVWHRLHGEWRHRRAEPWPVPLRAVLFDRDGTLVHDVPYNGDPDRVAPVPQAGSAVHRARAAGLRVGVVSNQSGVARGLLTPDAVDTVNAAVDRLLGPFDTWQVCPHGTDDGCDCRKPRPGLVLAAAKDLGVRPEQCAVIGDIGSDVLAARAAGASAVLVPTEATRPEEIADAPWVAPTLTEAVDLLLARRPS